MCVSPIWLKRGIVGLAADCVPCGRCPECLEQKRKLITKKLMLEAKSHGNATFITLTFHDKYLPFVLGRPQYEPELDSIVQPAVPSLDISIIQRFFKRLRVSAKRHFRIDNLRIFYCGEYGSKFGRPHFHAIVFGLDLVNHSDTYLATTKHADGKDYPIFANRWLEKIWPFGFVTVDACTPRSMSYVAKYVTKKYEHNALDYNGKVKEFVRGSNFLGLRHVIKYAEEIFRDGTVMLDYGHGPVPVSLPSYYINKHIQSEANYMLTQLAFGVNAPWLLSPNFEPAFCDDSGSELKRRRKERMNAINLEILKGNVKRPMAHVRKAFVKAKWAKAKESDVL